MVGMRGDKAFRAEGDNHVGAEAADEGRQAPGDLGEVCAKKIPVGVIPQLAGGDAEVMAGVGELAAADGLQRGIVGDARAIGRPFTAGQADDGALHALARIL